jgi:putative membrane protein
MPSDLREPRRTSPLAALFWVFRGEQLRTLLPVALVAVTSGRNVVLVLAGALVLGAAFGLLSWWRRAWSFADGVLRVDEGVLVRSERRIPVERIQHVELERRLRHQLFDLASVRVETAGGSGAELTLDAIRLTDAEAVRTAVLEHLRAPVAADGDEGPSLPPPPAPPEVLVRLTPSRLLLAGITGPEVAAVLAALAVALDTLGDLGVDPEDVGSIDASGAALALLLAAAVPVWLAVAGLIGVVRRWDLTATIVADELRVTYGLLRRNEFVVKTARVQDVRISHRFLLRPFGRADVRVRTAASGSGERSRVDIPLLGADEIDVVLRRVLPQAVPLPPLVPAPPAARRRALVRGGAGGGLLAVVLVALAAVATTSLVLAAALALVAALGLGEASFRGLGAARTGAVVHTQTGALTRNRTIVPDERVQSAAVVSSFFQRRRGLASVRLDLAGDSVGVVDRASEEARALVPAVLGRATAPTSVGAVSD